MTSSRCLTLFNDGRSVELKPWHKKLYIHNRVTTNIRMEVNSSCSWVTKMEFFVFPGVTRICICNPAIANLYETLEIPRLSRSPRVYASQWRMYSTNWLDSKDHDSLHIRVSGDQPLCTDCICAYGGPCLIEDKTILGRDFLTLDPFTGSEKEYMLTPTAYFYVRPSFTWQPIISAKTCICAT